MADVGGTTAGSREGAPSRQAPQPASGAPGAMIHPKAPAAEPTRGAGKAKEGPSERAPLVVYTGGMRMLSEADKIPATIDRIIDVAESYGGGVLGRRDDAVDIRVSSTHFREAMSKLEGVGAVIQRSVKAEDVSEQFHDLEVRLSNLKATQKRMQDFLARAQNLSEALVVERELERVALEIDGIEGKLSFLRNRTSFSQISVTFQVKPKEAAPVVATPVATARPQRSTPDLPVEWLSRLGLDPLLSMKSR